MVKAGMRKVGTPQFFAGHSLGGAMLHPWAADNAERVAGQILMGSFITRAFKENYKFAYPSTVPTLTIGGELDGLARVTRLAEAFYTQVSAADDVEEAERTFPVTVVAGVTHMQFASGEPPDNVRNRDLLPEVSYDEAHALIAADAVAFLSSQLSPRSEKGSQKLLQRVQETREFVQPIITALQLEGYHNFLPPCLCPDDTCVSIAGNCTGGCPFTATVSQATMAVGGLEGLTVDNTDSFHDVWETEPTVHLPDIKNTCPDGHDPNNGHGGCKLQTTTITQGVYHTGEDLEIWKKHFDVAWLDTGYFPLSAVELRTKMVSRQNAWTEAGEADVDFEEVDGGAVRCGEINQAALDWARSATAQATVARYDAHGQHYVVGPDVDVCPAGPCWIWEELHYTPSEDRKTVVLTSPQFATETDFPLPKTAGFHYCKVLSPARAVEWMYVDSLREFYSLKSQQ